MTQGPKQSKQGAYHARLIFAWLTGQESTFIIPFHHSSHCPPLLSPSTTASPHIAFVQVHSLASWDFHSQSGQSAGNNWTETRVSQEEQKSHWKEWTCFFFHPWTTVQAMRVTRGYEDVLGCSPASQQVSFNGSCPMWSHLDFIRLFTKASWCCIFALLWQHILQAYWKLCQ